MPYAIACPRHFLLALALLATCLATSLRADDQGVSDEAWNTAVSAPLQSRIKVMFRDGTDIEGTIAAVLTNAIVVEQVKVGRRWVSRPGDAPLEAGLTIRRELVASVTILSAALPSPPAAISFDQLQVLVRRGDKVRVTDASGSRRPATIMNVTPSVLSLKVGESIRELTERDVAVIQQRRGDPLANGALTGLGVGAGFGMIVCGRCHVGPGLVAAGVYGGIGAGIGVGIDALLRSDVVVFQRKVGGGPRISVAPQLASSHKGVTVSVRF
jgi:hypothetical protein